MNDSEAQTKLQLHLLGRILRLEARSEALEAAIGMCAQTSNIDATALLLQIDQIENEKLQAKLVVLEQASPELAAWIDPRSNDAAKLLKLLLPDGSRGS